MSGHRSRRKEKNKGRGGGKEEMVGGMRGRGGEQAGVPPKKRIEN
jgi:hypothetical protein